MTRLNAANMAYTTLAAAINDEVTTLALADATGFPVAPFMITIGDEIIEVRSRTTTTCSDLIRGAEGTVAAAHSQGDSIEHRWTAGTLNRIWNDNDVVLGAGASLDGLNAVVVGRDALAGNLGDGSGDGHITIGHGANTRVNKTQNHNNYIAIGTNAKTGCPGTFQEGIGGAIAIGHNASTLRPGQGEVDRGAVAIGWDADATKGNENIAIGYQAESGMSSVAIGGQASALPASGISLGCRATDTSSIGTAMGHIAIGHEAIVGNSGNISFGHIAIGYEASTSINEATEISGSIAIGITAESLGTGSMAIGAAARTGNIGAGTGNNHVAIGHGASTLTTAAGARNDYIAMGNGALTGVHSGVTAAACGKAIAIGSGASTRTNIEHRGDRSAIAIGESAKALHSDTIAIGRQAEVTEGLASIAIGYNANVGVGTNNIAIGQSVSIVGPSITQHHIVIGRGAKAGNLGSGINASSIAIGDGASVQVDTSSTTQGMVAIGYNAVATVSYDFVLGSTSHNVKIPGTFEVLPDGGGMIVTTPDGTKRYRISVNDEGNVATTLL